MTLAERVVHEAVERGLFIATAESCTGGLIAAALTDVAGSSAVFERGFVTYSNLSKTQCLGVPSDLLERYGAVSGEVAGAMASGTLTRTPADLALSVTGIAGPGGGTEEKPVGLVWFGVATRAGVRTERRQFDDADGRSEIRAASVSTALQLALESFGP